MLDLNRLSTHSSIPASAHADAGYAATGRVLNDSASGVTRLVPELTQTDLNSILVKRYSARFTDYLAHSPVLSRLGALQGKAIAGLPTLLQASENEGELRLLMSGQSGEPLDQTIAAHMQGSRSEVTIGMIGRLASALARLHAGGLLHLDVHPGAIVLNPNGQDVDFIDWGHTVPVQDAGQAASALPVMSRRGMTYSSPELLAGTRPSAGDDVFSLGCVAYELLSGQHPFGRRSGIDLSSSGVQPAPIAGLRDECNSGLLQALALCRDQRVITMQQLATAFCVETAPQPRRSYAVLSDLRALCTRRASRRYLVIGATACAWLIALAALVGLSIDGRFNRMLDGAPEQRTDNTAANEASKEGEVSNVDEVSKRNEANVETTPGSSTVVAPLPMDAAKPDPRVALAEVEPPAATVAQTLSAGTMSNDHVVDRPAITARSSDSNWKTYRGDRQNFSFKYPASLVLTANSPEDLVELRSSDREFSFRARAVNDSGALSTERIWQRNVEERGASITYKRKAADWFVLSGVQDGQIYYKKLFVRSGRETEFVITYPKARAELYDSWVRAIEKSFYPSGLSVSVSSMHPRSAQIYRPK